MGEPEVTKELAFKHGLSQEEWNRVLDILGRTPTYPELGIFSVMWSEHCSYKSSRIHLKRFPTEGPRVLQGPGENAGVVDIGDGWAVAFKMESHNHPSYIEPYQGAATGVGGILRDIFTMGARPIANMNSLHFGSPDHPKTPHLMRGVVAGIGDYGNCMGIPTVGGQVVFHPCYDGNILVNAFTLGVLRSDRIFRGYASGIGNPILYVGSKTGRDGIHGATMASEEFSEATEEKRPTVQVGDPFTEKLLLEACLELMEEDVIVGIQDMGAAGLTSSSFEMAGRSGSGIRITLEDIPMREEEMTPYELLLSESQERMLIVAKKGGEKRVAEIFSKWKLDAVKIGEVTDTGRAELFWHGEKVVDIPVSPIAAQAPVYRRPSAPPDDLAGRRELHLGDYPERNCRESLLAMVSHPDLCSRRWIYTQYDQSVRTNTVAGPGADAALVRVKGTVKAIAMSLDVDPRYCKLDPYLGGKLAVVESARNVSCVGAKPLALTDCLNFGNPERSHVMWEFERAVDGISEAAEALGTPVVSGNVSFYNETKGEGIYPTPTIGMVGLLEDVDKRMTPWFVRKGDPIALLGNTAGHLGASAYLWVLFGRDEGTPPPLDMERERALQELLRLYASEGMVKSCHDCSTGGLLIAVAECGIAPHRTMGVVLDLQSKGLKRSGLLFGEDASRAVVSCSPSALDDVKAAADRSGIPFTVIGRVGGARLRVNVDDEEIINLPMEEVRMAWDGGLTRVVG